MAHEGRANGPYDTEAQTRPATRPVYEAFDANPGVGKMAPHNYRLMRDALTAAKVDVGAYDDRIIRWLAEYEPATCAVVAGLITRASEAATLTCERAEQLAAARLDALAAVREALDIPHAATTGEDCDVRTPILLNRVRHVLICLETLTGKHGERDLTWSVAYLRERLAENPADGYKTWDEAMAELRERQQGEPEAEPDQEAAQ